MLELETSELELGTTRAVGSGRSAMDDVGVEMTNASTGLIWGVRGYFGFKFLPNFDSFRLQS